MKKLTPLEKLRRQRPEADVLAAIRDYLTLVPGVRIRRMQEREGRDGHYRQSGIRGEPDLQGWIRLTHLRAGPAVNVKAGPISVPLFIEAKRTKGRRSPEQIAFIDTAKADGCIAIFAECVNDVRDALTAWGIYAP